MFRKEVTVLNPTGLHARPAAEFVAAAKGFSSRITVRRCNMEGQGSNGKSILALMTLGASRGTLIEISADGPDEEAAVDALAALVEGGFGEL